MASIVAEVASNRLNLTATQTISCSSIEMLGILVAQSSAGTIQVTDTKGIVVNTMNVIAGQYYPIPCRLHGPVTITIGGTLDATVFYCA